MKHKKMKIDQRLSWSARLRYAVSDLRHRLLTASFPVVGISIGTGTFLVLSFYGHQFYRYQQGLVSGETLTHITAMCEDIGDRKARFTKERLEELDQREDIATVYPKLEQGVSLTAGVTGQMQIPAEGILSGDPRIHDGILDWVARDTSGAEPWIYISRQVFQKLGGVVQADAPQPSSLTLKVARKKDGREEQLELSVEIRGILSRQKTDRVYIPQELAQQLDKYTSHKMDELGEGEEGRSTSGDYEYAYAYVRPEHESRLASEAQHMNIQAIHDGNVDVLVADKLPIWGWIQGAAEEAISVSALQGITVSVPGTKSFPEFSSRLQTRHGIVTVVALSHDDPRWENVPGGIPERGLLVAKDAKYRSLSLGKSPVEARVEIVCESLPIVGDLVCSPETLAWIQFQPADCEEIDHEVVLLTESPSVARALATSGLEVRCDNPTAWSIFSMKPQSTANLSPAEGSSTISSRTDMSMINQKLTEMPISRPVADGLKRVDILGVSAPAQAGIMEDAMLNAEYGFLGRGKVTLQARIIPDALFSLLVDGDIGTITYNDRIPCIKTARLPDDIQDKQLSINGRRLDVYESDYVREDGPHLFWIPKSAATEMASSRIGNAIAVWGRWDHVLDAGQRLSDAETIGPALYQDGPSQFWCVAQESGRDIVGRLTAAGGPFRYATLWTASSKSGRIAAIVEQKGLVSTHIQALLDRDDYDVALRDQRSFCREVFEANEKKYTSDASRLLRYSISVTSPLGYQMLSRAVEERGYHLQEMTQVREEAWARYIVTDRSSDDGHVAEDLIGIIGMTKPTFAAVEPYLSVTGSISKSGIPLMGTTSSDPFQFVAEVRKGGWISGGSTAEIVLPVALTPSSIKGESLIGQFVEVKFQREDPVTRRAEDLVMAMQLVGITDGSTGFIPVSLAKNLDRWARNECMFNATKGTFETPMETYERRGFIRANIIAANAESLETLVQWLEAQGYRTESSLGNIAGLKQLGKSLVVVVSIFSIGTLLTAAITVLVTALMNVNSKAWEIGLLKALGVGDREILAIFLIQAVIISVAGFFGATLFAGFIEPLLFRKLLSAVFGSGISDIISGTVLSLQNWFLAGTALAVSIVFSLLGMTFPALKACRMVPVKALNNRD